MSATLIVLIPLALFGVTALLGFVGCTLPVTGLDDPYDTAVTNEGSNLVAFWSLTETSGTTAADKSANHFNGTYQMNVTINQPGIIPGDAPPQGQEPCPLFNGGLVSVGFRQAINMKPPFSIEAWVKPGWSATDAALRGVVVSNSKAQGAGFGLFASPENQWLFSLGMTPASGPATSIEVKPPVGGPTIDFDNAVHLVVVYDDNQVCTIFVNGGQLVSTDTTKSGLYNPLQDGGTPLFIGAGAPDLGTSPLNFPFNGKIQCVAIYSEALSQETIQSHFNTGMGA